MNIYIATAKPLPSALIVLEYFKIDKYFKEVSGATFDGTIKGKTEVISNLLTKLGDVDRGKTIMIGDRDHDIIGAKKNGILSAGVLYGYGSKDELKDADFLVEDTASLKELLLQEI